MIYKVMNGIIMKFLKAAATQIFPFGDQNTTWKRSFHAFMISKKLCSMSIMCPWCPYAKHKKPEDK
jgi:hypothetical protein